MAKNNNTHLIMQDVDLSVQISKYYYDPLGYIIFAFPWGEEGTPLEHAKLETWQYRFLKKLGDDLQKRGLFTGIKPVRRILTGAVTGHGVGKSALLGMLSSWLMSTRPQCKGTITAGTFAQLETKTWPELTSWMKLSVTGHWFEYQTRRIQHIAEHQMNSNAWRIDLQTSAKENSGKFAGQHARNSSSFYLFDEASEIPDKIWEVTEGGLTDGEPFWFAFGNCNLNTGRFYEASFGKARSKWDLFHVDSREVSFTNKDDINDLIDEYGINSDVVKVRYLGQAPKHALNQYIGYDLVEMAQQRNLEQHEFNLEPRVLGVDPAGDGEDEHVVVMRQGYNCWVLGAWKHLTYETTELGDVVAKLEDDWQTSATFVEVHGVGIGTISRLKQLGRKPISVNLLNTTVNSPEEHKNKRDEIWSDMRKWLYEGGSIPADDAILGHNLTMPLSIFDEKYVRVESKKSMRSRGEESPGRAEALANTFYAPVRSTARMEHYYRVTGNLDKINRFNKEKTKHEYDPWSRS